MAAPDPTELTRKLRQHDNEFEAVYGLLQTLDRKVDAGFERVDARFAQVDARFTTVDERLSRLDDGQQQILEILRDLRGGASGSA